MKNTFHAVSCILVIIMLFACTACSADLPASSDPAESSVSQAVSDTAESSVSQAVSDTPSEESSVTEVFPGKYAPDEKTLRNYENDCKAQFDKLKYAFSFAGYEELPSVSYGLFDYAAAKARCEEAVEYMRANGLTDDCEPVYCPDQEEHYRHTGEMGYFGSPTPDDAFGGAVAVCDEKGKSNFRSPRKQYTASELEEDGDGNYEAAAFAAVRMLKECFTDIQTDKMTWSVWSVSYTGIRSLSLVSFTYIDDRAEWQQVHADEPYADVIVTVGVEDDTYTCYRIEEYDRSKREYLFHKVADPLEALENVVDKKTAALDAKIDGFVTRTSVDPKTLNVYDYDIRYFQTRGKRDKNHELSDDRILYEPFYVFMCSDAGEYFVVIAPAASDTNA